MKIRLAWHRTSFSILIDSVFQSDDFNIRIVYPLGFDTSPRIPRLKLPFKSRSGGCDLPYLDPILGIRVVGKIKSKKPRVIRGEDGDSVEFDTLAGLAANDQAVDSLAMGYADDEVFVLRDIPNQAVYRVTGVVALGIVGHIGQLDRAPIQKLEVQDVVLAPSNLASLGKQMRFPCFPIF